MVEAIFHSDSCGVRPCRSGLDPIQGCRMRCWKYSREIDLDIQAFLGTGIWDLVIRGAIDHKDESWVVLYVQRWFAAPL